MLTHYPATLQNYKATRPCKAALPPDLGVKQAKRLTVHHWPKTVDAIRDHLQGVIFQHGEENSDTSNLGKSCWKREKKKRNIPMGPLEARSPTPQRRSLHAKT